MSKNTNQEEFITTETAKGFRAVMLSSEPLWLLKEGRPKKCHDCIGRMDVLWHINKSGSVYGIKNPDYVPHHEPVEGDIYCGYYAPTFNKKTQVIILHVGTNKVCGMRWLPHLNECIPYAWHNCKPNPRDFTGKNIDISLFMSVPLDDEGES